jgi:hypothetical protein
MKRLPTAIAAALLATAPIEASIWLQQRADNQEAGKTFELLQGTFPDGRPLEAGEATLYVRDMEGNLQTRQIPADAPFLFKEALQGSYHLFVLLRRVEGDTLRVTVAKTRVYNRYGDTDSALLDEIRGKSVGSHYGKPPLPGLPIEIVLDKPIKHHQINCCIYSGDLLPFTVYRDANVQTGIPLQVTTQKGWRNTVNASGGEVVFEVPRTTYADIYTNKRYREWMLVEASQTVSESGVYDDKPYTNVRYDVTVPLSFHASPLEYSSKLGGFLTLIGVMLVFSLGAYYHRKRKQSRNSDREAWFDEHA